MLQLLHRIGGKFEQSWPWTSLVGLRPCSLRGYMLWRICGWCQCHSGKVQIGNSNYVWNMSIKAVPYPEKETWLLTMHAPTSSVCVLGIPLLMTFMHPLMLGNVQELVRNTWNCQNCTGILMCCLGTSNIYIIRNSTFFFLSLYLFT